MTLMTLFGMWLSLIAVGGVLVAFIIQDINFFFRLGIFLVSALPFIAATLVLVLL